VRAAAVVMSEGCHTTGIGVDAASMRCPRCRPAG
jgi:hypothetical protein